MDLATMDPSLRNIVGPAMICGVFLLIYLFAQNEKKHRRLFAEQLRSNLSLAETGAAEIDGVMLTKDTEITTYKVCLSLLVIAYRFDTRYVRVGEPKAYLLSFICSLISFVFGWWSIWGLMWTPEALIWNFSNAGKRRIASVMEDLHK